MKKNILFLLPLLTITSLAPAQKNRRELEITPYVRFDKYQQFTYNFAGRFFTDSLAMKGTGFGLNVSYKYAFKPFFVIGGVGYYNYAFNKLIGKNYLGLSRFRPLEFPNRVQILYGTDAYYYRTVSLNIGFGRDFRLGKEIWLSTSAMGSNYFTFRQAYKISEEPTYKSSNTKSFAQSLMVKAGLLRQVGNTTIGPNFFVPLYSRWHKDEVFLENPAEKREKWLKGWGTGIDINFKL